ncbi:hypothetical protein [Ascidiaceihabitans sp.]|uniref:hypothetical protein n=1 Tax=Ascidiaceihabitans sp. TaxID=1872644 RepID=UPI003299B756
MLLASPPPPDALYIGTTGAVFGLGLVLGVIQMRPAWHALGIGILFASVGHLTLYLHLQDAVYQTDAGVRFIPFPPASRFATPGLWFLGFALWLYLTRMWMGKRTQRLVLTALWTTVTCQIAAYYAESGTYDPLPHTSQDAFLEALRHNAILEHIHISAQVAVVIGLMVIILAPVVWRMRFIPQTKS